MAGREQLLEVYRHKDIGYVSCFFTDFDFIQPVNINERPDGDRRKVCVIDGK